MSSDEKCPYCGAEKNERDGSRVFYACGTIVGPRLRDRMGACYDRELSQVKAERDRLMAMLRRLEHQGRDADRTPICPVCLATDVEPHYADCELAALLQEEQSC